MPLTSNNVTLFHIDMPIKQDNSLVKVWYQLWVHVCLTKSNNNQRTEGTEVSAIKKTFDKEAVLV